MCQCWKCWHQVNKCETCTLQVRFFFFFFTLLNSFKGQGGFVHIGFHLLVWIAKKLIFVFVCISETVIDTGNWSLLHTHTFTPSPPPHPPPQYWFLWQAPCTFKSFSFAVYWLSLSYIACWHRTRIFDGLTCIEMKILQYILWHTG